MLTYLEGMIISSSSTGLILDVGGIAFSLSVPRSECFDSGKKAKITVYFHWNQEQGPSLFGFVNALERDIFSLIISCSGMGPKIALAVLRQLSTTEFLRAIQEGDEKALSSISGIGAKKAEQMIVHLRHKVEKLIQSGVQIDGDSASFEQWKNVADVLKSLNYSRPEIESALAQTKEHFSGASYTFDQLLRHSLSFLAKRV